MRFQGVGPERAEGGGQREQDARGSKDSATVWIHGLGVALGQVR
jgi:hypothetical protein